MMEIVIKIHDTPQNDHERWVLKNGTPLPKGHGRLKDVDAFISKVKVDRKHSVYLRSWTADDVLNALDNSYVSTIIEADKESEE